MTNSRLNHHFLAIGPVEVVSTGQIATGQSLRIFKRETIRKAARFLETFGLKVPIILDASNEIVEGEIWFHAAKHLEWPEVPVLRIGGLTPSQLTAYRIGIQRIPQSAEWDDAALAAIFKEWSSEDLDFDVELTGFSAAEIDSLIEANSAKTAPPAADEICATDLGAPVTLRDDMWLAGDHRLLCGNSLETSALQALLGREKAAVVITDPPYNTVVDGHVGGKGRIRHREFAMASGEMTLSQFSEFLSKSFRQLIEGSRDGSIHYIFMDWRHASEVLIAGHAVYSELKNLCVWVKANGGMGSFYRSRHELVFVFKKGRARHRNNVELGKNGRNRTNVWEYGGINGFDGRHSDEGNLLALHPTVKPVQMIADALLDSSARGEIVLDIFHGSGSTLIAAERTGRRLFGIEIDPVYVDVAIRRWQRHTGQQAIHHKTGRTFEQTRQDRQNDPSRAEAPTSNGEAGHLTNTGRKEQKRRAVSRAKANS